MKAYSVSTNQDLFLHNKEFLRPGWYVLWSVLYALHNYCPGWNKPLLHAHEMTLQAARAMAKQAAQAGDDGTNDILVSDVIRPNELQVWFLAEHLVEMPLVCAVDVAWE